MCREIRSHDTGQPRSILSIDALLACVVDDLAAIASELRIASHEVVTSHQCLSDHDAIERIPMDIFQDSQSGSGHPWAAHRLQPARARWCPAAGSFSDTVSLRHKRCNHCWLLWLIFCPMRNNIKGTSMK